MTVSRLAEILKQCPQDAKVLVTEDCTVCAVQSLITGEVLLIQGEEDD